MNIQQQQQPQMQQIQTGQPIYLSSDNTRSQIIQIANNNNNNIHNQNQNVIYTNQQIFQQNSNGYYLIQQPQQTNNSQISILPTSSTNTLPQTVKQITQHQQQQQQQQQPIIIQNNVKYQAQPRIIIQQPASTSQVILPQQTNQNGQIFLNINNRIVPIQSVNIKQATTTPTPSVTNNPQFLIVSNNNQNTTGDLNEKMKQLEQIQTQLKQYQQKILQVTNQGQTVTQTVLTQAQIQAALTQEEQIQLQKLIVSKKTIESEIQLVKQKNTNLPQTTTITTPATPAPTQAPTPAQNKLQLLQQVTQKLNALKSSKTVTVDSATGQQQLVLTHEEFDQMKKLIDLQNSLQNELKSTSTEQQKSPATPQPQITTTINLTQLNLNEKLKLNDLIKNQLEQIKKNLITQTNKDLVESMKEKYNLLVKKQCELQLLIDKEKEASSTALPKQTPVKIRNVITTTNQLMNKTVTTAPTSPHITTTTPLRTLVINNKDNSTVTQTIISQSQPLLSLQQALNLKKTNFPNLQFKCLSFEELAQNGVITKDTDELTISLLRQLDDKASQVINREQLESFQKNQVKLAKKYLEQQQLAKQNIKNRISEQLLKDQKLATEPDFRTAFHDKTDAIKRLSRYHVFQKTYYEPSEQESEKFEECYDQVSERLLKIADAMKKRFNLLQLRTMHKEVSSSEETLLLKLYVDDLKQDIEHEKQEIKERQQNELKTNINPQNQTHIKPQIQIIKTDSPQTIRNLIKMNQTNSENSNNGTCLKRLLKTDEDLNEKSNKIQKLESSVSFISTDKSESNTSLNQLSSSAYPSSSSSSFITKQESNNKLNTELEHTLNHNKMLLDDYDDDDSNDSLNDYEQFETFRQQNTNCLGLNEDNSSSGLNNFSNLDDFILNDDDLPQNFLDY
ncbi:unnamed protein product [Brachionus calyciflorus]|uniref:GLTSCR protein conserved domain-containing protein n=1 Tax=Brachionus calyciflorus TaxID=104777 RepID=A0A813P7N0_9BILA|nr:unnamed protein product [Brachionus calyciflorus]